MKKIFYSILLSGMMVLSACDALDLSPEDYYGSNDFWNQKSQVEMFMTGIHADLRDKYQMPVTLGEFRSEILISDVTSMGEGVYGIIRKSKFPQNPKRSVRFSGKGTKRSVQKRKARNTQKAETKVL